MTLCEIVCPQFYVEEWEAEGRRYTDSDDPKVEFKTAADDGVCRLLRTTRDEFGGVVFVCRCGIHFTSSDAKKVSVR